MTVMAPGGGKNYGVNYIRPAEPRPNNYGQVVIPPPSFSMHRYFPHNIEDVSVTPISYAMDRITGGYAQFYDRARRTWISSADRRQKWVEYAERENEILPTQHEMLAKYAEIAQTGGDPRMIMYAYGITIAGFLEVQGTYRRLIARGRSNSEIEKFANGRHSEMLRNIDKDDKGVGKRDTQILTKFWKKAYRYQIDQGSCIIRNWKNNEKAGVVQAQASQPERGSFNPQNIQMAIGLKDSSGKQLYRDPTTGLLYTQRDRINYIPLDNSAKEAQARDYYKTHPVPTKGAILDACVAKIRANRDPAEVMLEYGIPQNVWVDQVMSILIDQGYRYGANLVPPQLAEYMKNRKELELQINALVQLFPEINQYLTGYDLLSWYKAQYPIRLRRQNQQFQKAFVDLGLDKVAFANRAIQGAVRRVAFRKAAWGIETVN